jgi:hypothetical protein
MQQPSPDVTWTRGTGGRASISHVHSCSRSQQIRGVVFGAMFVSNKFTSRLRQNTSSRAN